MCKNQRPIRTTLIVNIKRRAHLAWQAWSQGIVQENSIHTKRINNEWTKKKKQKICKWKNEKEEVKKENHAG